LQDPACVVPVPTVDLWIPWPFIGTPRFTIWNDLIDVQAGDFGRLCWRVPGSEHPMFATGLGHQFIVPDELSELGRSYVAYRASQGQPILGSAIVALFDYQWAGSSGSPAWRGRNLVVPYWWTRDFNASHMQCLTPLRYAPGEPVRWRWQYGGERPRPYVGQGFDVFEILLAGGSAWASSWPALRRYARTDAGVLLETMAPEHPAGPNVVNGPAPGAFA
jgi:hypothetical protein